MHCTALHRAALLLCKLVRRAARAWRAAHAAPQPSRPNRPASPSLLPRGPTCYQALAVNEFTGPSWSYPYNATQPEGPTMGHMVRAGGPQGRSASGGAAAVSLRPSQLLIFFAAFKPSFHRPPTPFSPLLLYPAGGSQPQPQILEFRGFGTEYWWVWLGLGTTLASIVINVTIFVLAATFLKGACGHSLAPLLHSSLCSAAAACAPGRACTLAAACPGTAALPLCAHAHCLLFTTHRPQARAPSR